MAAALPMQPASRRAMITPAIDALCIGGASIVVCLALAFFGPRPFVDHVSPAIPYGLTLAVTWPHFLSSYRLLYAERASVLTYRWASIYFPILLAAACLFAVARSPVDARPVNALTLLASVYLARHYTGQTWGMMASFSYVAGAPFAPAERRFSLIALDMMMAWHVTWALARTIAPVVPALAPMALEIDAHIDALGFASFAVGLGALVAMTRRIGALPPVRVLVPWLALYSWYVLIRRDTTALVVVQVAHALQYLVFPLRIQETRRDPRVKTLSPRRVAIWLAILVALSFAVFAGIPALFRVAYEDAGGTGDMSSAFVMAFVAFVNVHHYFIDGCLYKLRNPAVRRDLFAHLEA